MEIHADARRKADNARTAFKQKYDNLPVFDHWVAQNEAWPNKAAVIFYLQSKVAYVDVPSSIYIVKYFHGVSTKFEFQSPEAVKTKLSMFEFRYSAGFNQEGVEVFATYKGRHYLKDGGCTNFNMVIFDPDDQYCRNEENREKFNTYHGLAFTPEANFIVDNNKVALFTSHVLQIMAAGDEHLGVWLLKWLAHIIQYPGTKSGCCSLFRSRQGTGKSLCFKIFSKLLGRDLCIEVASKDELVGKFNGITANKLLIIADEVMFGGEHAASNKIKTLVTSKECIIEKKFMNRIVTNSCERYVFLSNEKWPLRVEGSDRRTACFEVSSERINDRVHFGILDAFYSDHENLKHLFHFFYSYQPDGVPIELIMFPPNTKLKDELRAMTRNEYERFFLDLLALENGCEDVRIVDGDFMTCNELLVMFRDWCSKNGLNPLTGSITTIGNTIRPILERVRRRVDGRPCWGYIWIADHVRAGID